MRSHSCARVSHYSAHTHKAGIFGKSHGELWSFLVSLILRLSEIFNQPFHGKALKDLKGFIVPAGNWVEPAGTGADQLDT